MLAQGQGVPENGAEAAKWFRLAAEQGDAMGQYALGFMYDYGEGLSPGLVRGRLHSAISRAMKPRSGSASLASTSWFT